MAIPTVKSGHNFNASLAILVKFLSLKIEILSLLSTAILKWGRDMGYPRPVKEEASIGIARCAMWAVTSAARYRRRWLGRGLYVYHFLSTSEDDSEEATLTRRRPILVAETLKITKLTRCRGSRINRLSGKRVRKKKGRKKLVKSTKIWLSFMSLDSISNPFLL